MNAPSRSLGGRSWSLSFATHLAAFAALWFVGRPHFIDLTQVDWSRLGTGRAAVIEVELNDDDVWRRPGIKGVPKVEKKAPAPRPVEASAGVAGTGYRTVAQVSRLPKPVSALDAAFPEEARRAGVEGTVILQVDIDEAGLVKQVSVVQPLGHGCDEAAVAAVQGARFIPAAAGDVPVPVRVRIPFRFQYQ